MPPFGKRPRLQQEVESRTADQDRFESLLQAYDYSFNRGAIVQGRVIGFEGSTAMVDIGAKTAALVPAKEVVGHGQSVTEALKVGDPYDFFILREENEEGQLTLSRKRVQTAQSWQKLEAASLEDQVLECPVNAVVKGGVLVDVMGLRGFVPSSHLRVKHPLEDLIGTVLPLKVINLDQSRNNIILSHRKVMSEQLAEQRRELFANLKVGTVVEGEVVRLTDFGAFIDLGGVDGLLPLSQMSWRWVQHPADLLKVGDVVRVEVIGVDPERHRVSLSIKSQSADPWNEVANHLRQGVEVEGMITRIKHFGAFVEVYPGVEALLPSKDLTDFETANDLKLDVGQKVKTYIQKFNPEERRISLGFHSPGGGMANYSYDEDMSSVPYAQ